MKAHPLKYFYAFILSYPLLVTTPSLPTPGGCEPSDEEHDEPADPEPGGGRSPLCPRLCPLHCHRLRTHVRIYIWLVGIVLVPENKRTCRLGTELALDYIIRQLISFLGTYLLAGSNTNLDYVKVLCCSGFW